MAHPDQHRGICIQNLIWLHNRAKTDEQSVQKTSIANNFRDRDHTDQKVPPKRDRNQEKPRNRENIGRVEMNRAVGKRNLDLFWTHGQRNSARLDTAFNKIPPADKIRDIAVYRVIINIAWTARSLKRNCRYHDNLVRHSERLSLIAFHLKAKANVLRHRQMQE